MIWKLGKVKRPPHAQSQQTRNVSTSVVRTHLPKGPLFALTAGSTGDLTPEKKNGTFAGCAWLEAKAGPGMASPVSNGQFLYVADNNILRCYDAKTGERLYQNRLPGLKMVAASPLIIGDKLLVLDEAGAAALVRLARNSK